MISVKFNNKGIIKDLNNIVNYSLGFLEGAEAGKTAFLNNLGVGTIEALKQFVDSIARTSPETMHHVYEWGQTGSPNARLFDIEYTVSNLGLSLKSTFRQSTSIKSGSNTPFYNKARIMESGIPVQIKPKNSTVLVFEQNGETVFTPNPVRVVNPGGSDVPGSYERAFDMFINQYFSQAFLNSSGIMGKLKDLSIYKKNLSVGARAGKSHGLNIGYRWIMNAGIVN
jgi:hypothetical protein